ncbi:predicted protein [Histoplasma capsulatum var. duboisii H88]|uniref:Predicted protein n=2 Tax=Ajellomyces capsulatus TaxID=5037 RepID=F0UCK9_AJEC8|nr:predicted protein [Histoplasma capsulatum H143]EGC43285.1 predicted protein [Histoplasma capsulatum var. duboisii H88]
MAEAARLNLFCEQVFCIEDAKEFCSRRNRSLSPLPKLIKPWSGSKSGHTQAFATIRATEMFLAALSLLDAKPSYNDSPAHEKNPRSSRDCVPCHADEPLLRAIISLDYIPTGGYTILLRIVYGVHGIHGVRGRPAIDAISR